MWYCYNKKSILPYQQHNPTLTCRWIAIEAPNKFEAKLRLYAIGADATHYDSPLEERKDIVEMQSHWYGIADSPPAPGDGGEWVGCITWLFDSGAQQWCLDKNAEQQAISEEEPEELE